MANTRIGIIGHGHVGSALERGLTRAGFEVRAVGSDPTAVRETAAWAETVVLAVPFGALDEVSKLINPVVDGKPVVDVTNALASDMSLAVGFTTSGAEELQKKLPTAHVVKAFNTVFAKHMATGHLGDQPLTAFVAGDDLAAKRSVLEMATAIGFDAIDAGPLRNARLIEPMAAFNIQLGYGLNMGTEIGLELLHH
ncbi:MAG: NADP oxidoreductase [Deltaproteobacteria bacterium]|nr:NADP oxidoreductase [Deltaproteobacteria bacterium]